METLVSQLHDAIHDPLPTPETKVEKRKIDRPLTIGRLASA
jgi:hypothetical protein